MPNLTIATIQGLATAVVTVADDTLVYNGHSFVQPRDAKYVELHLVDVAAKSLVFGSIAQASLDARYTNLARVLSVDDQTGEATTPSLTSSTDPSEGICICLVTCKGTALTYVQVYNQ